MERLELFDPITEEVLPEIDFDSCPMLVSPVDEVSAVQTIEGGLKNKVKGGALFQRNANKEKIINSYLLVKKGLENINEFELSNNGVRTKYGTLSDADKMKHLKNITGIMHLFVRLLNSCSDYVKQYISSKGLAGGLKKQLGGADDFALTKIYNTQGLIVDNNNPIDNAMSYINTADQIPQPFSSSSSGVSYSSGLEPQFLQDVLPVLNMAGGVKQKLKSKRDRK